MLVAVHNLVLCSNLSKHSYFALTHLLFCSKYNSIMQTNTSTLIILSTLHIGVILYMTPFHTMNWKYNIYLVHVGMLFAIQELFDSPIYFIMGIAVSITLYITFTQTGSGIANRWPNRSLCLPIVRTGIIMFFLPCVSDLDKWMGGRELPARRYTGGGGGVQNGANDSG